MNGTNNPRILVTGATGYIASRLMPRLIEAGWIVRATSRKPDDIARRHPGVEAIPSDLQDESSLEKVMADIDVAYYLVHSMGSKGFAGMDKKAAQNFARAAAAAGVKRIVYLGGLGAHDDTAVSTSRIAPRGRPHPRRGNGPGSGVPRCDRDRLGFGCVRDVAPSDRETAGDDRPPVAHHTHPADRGVGSDELFDGRSNCRAWKATVSSRSGVATP